MDLMKRFRLAVLFVMVAALFAATSASAKPPVPDFVLSPVGDETGASGEATLGSEVLHGCELSASCKGLTPRATYRIDYRAHYTLYDYETGRYYEW
jgi:hypothetical protein